MKTSQVSDSDIDILHKDSFWSVPTISGRVVADDGLWSAATALELVITDEGFSITLSRGSSDFNTVEVLHR